MGVSLRSTSLKFPFEPFDAERPANSDVVSARAMSMASAETTSEFAGLSDVVSARAMSMASLASKGKNSLANATAVDSNTYYLMVFENKKPTQT